MPAVTGLSARREQQVQELQLLRFARRFDGRMAREIRRAMKSMAKKRGNPGRMAEAKDEHKQRVLRILESEWQASFEWYGRRIIDALEKSNNLKAEFKEVPKTYQFDEAVRNWLATYGATKVTQIAGTTSDQAMEVINQVTAEGVREGLSEIQIGRNLTAAMAQQAAVLSQFRSRMIARTEVHGAANAANQLAAQASGIPMRKEWVASGGERTRSEHSRADGQTVGINESFTVGGESLDYPGDPRGSAGNIINCRCASVMVTD